MSREAKGTFKGRVKNVVKEVKNRVD